MLERDEDGRAWRAGCAMVLAGWLVAAGIVWLLARAAR